MESKDVSASRIAMTLFNIRDYCKTESELDASLDKIRAIGYDVVQVSAVPLEPAVIRRQLDKHGIRCCATHENYATICGDPLELCDKLDILGCDFAALAAPTVENRIHPEAYDRLAGEMNSFGAKMRSRGKKLGYHNHCFEFDRFDGRETMIGKLVRLTDPDCVFFELDVHWVTRGGGSPATWIRNLAGRIPVIHFKDFAIVDNAPVFCEVGEGNLDWPEILKACRDTEIPFYSIEQDRLFKDRDIFESMRISFDNLRAMGVR